MADEITDKFTKLNFANDVKNDFCFSSASSTLETKGKKAFCWLQLYRNLITKWGKIYGKSKTTEKKNVCDKQVIARIKGQRK